MAVMKTITELWKLMRESVEAMTSDKVGLLKHLIAREHLTSRTTAALTVGTGVCVVFYIVNKLRQRQRLPPGPRPLPLVGNLLSMRSNSEPFYITLQRWSKELYGPLVTIYLGHTPYVTLNNSDVVIEALVKKGSDFAGRPYMYTLDLFTDGRKNIAHATYSPTWKLHRKIGSKAVRLFMMGDHLERTVHEMVTKVTDKMTSESGPFNPHDYISVLMFLVLYMICFGECKDADDPVIKRLVEVTDQFNDINADGLLEDFIPPLRFCHTPSLRKARACVQEFTGHIRQQLLRHRETFSAANIRDITDSVLLAESEAKIEEDPDLMSRLTETHMVQMLTDLFGAGVDTSRATLDWALYCLAGHPEVQTQVREEVDLVTGSRMPSLSDRGCLPYTEATLYEVMRIGTVAPFGLLHQTVWDTSVGGYDIPEGTTVMINFWALHNDPDHWDQPQLFRPQRFLDDQGRLASKPDSFLPFSAGRRVCLGEAVAKPELLLVLACIVKKFRISLEPGTVFDPVPQNKLVNGVPKPYRIVVENVGSLSVD